MDAREIMTSPVLTVTPETPVKVTVELMLTNRVSGLPVVDGAGRLVGIVTEADVLLKESEVMPLSLEGGWPGGSLWLERLVSGRGKVAGRTVGEVMTHDVITAREGTPVHVLASRMVRFKVNRLPIVRGLRVVGIVTRADILRVFLKADETLTAEARRLVRNFPLTDESVALTVERGVVILSGWVRSPDRRSALLRRLEEIDGLVAVDDQGLGDGSSAPAATT